MFLGPHLPLAPHLTGEGSEAFTRVLDSITDGFMVLDAQWRITYMNEAARRMYAPHMADPSALIGRDHWEVFPTTRGTFLEQEYRRAVTQGAAVELENFYVPWEAWFSVRLFPIRDGGLSIYFRDVTEAKRADAALRASEEKYRFLFSSIDEGFAVIKMLWNADGSPADYRFIEVNGMFEKLTGLHSVTGRTAREVVPNLEAHWFEIYGRVASTGESVRFVEGSEAMGRWFDVYAFPLHREPDLVALLFTDVTARRQNEQEMARLSAAERARAAELQALLDVMPIGIGIAMDAECRDIRVNPSLAQLLGLQPQANASKTAADGERPENFRILDDAGQEIPDTELPMQVAAREGRAVLEHELSVAFADGRTVRLLEYAAPLFDEKGAPRGSVGAFVDITERRETAQRQAFLLSLEEAVRPLSDPDHIVATSARLLGQHLRANRCAYANIEADEDTMNITGDYCHEVASIVGRFTFTQFGVEVRELMRADKPYVVDDTENHPLEPGVLDSYRATSIRSVICVPLHKGGRFVAAMAVHQNQPRRWTAAEVKLVLQVANRCWEALERARVTHSLARAKEAAEAANRAKDNFLAALSHELRTPLTPVLMAAEDLCDDPALPQAMHETMCMMRRNITLEARLIDDLLDLTRIARGKFSLRLQEGDAHALMDLALEIVREDAQSKQQSIEVDLIASHTRLQCDPARLQQVFWNLFKNAVKFTPAGGRIHIRSFDEPDRVVVEVTDTGIGIEADALERIFLPFEQAATSPEHRFGGLGLGLSISKAIVEMHGGTITASSQGLDRGATFRVELPASPMPDIAVEEPPSSAAPPAQTPADPAALRLLVVEDHEHTLDILSRLLRRAGHAVVTASTVAAAKELAATHTFDLVISDIGLPDGTGNDLMESLHAQHGLRGIALTGYGMEEDERRARESGFVAHLTKPVDFAQLRRTLAQAAANVT
ncbi:MAG: PAS domain-containing protein [Prosthecobacter sp.]